MEQGLEQVSGRRVVIASFLVLTAVAAGLGYFIGAAVIPQRMTGTTAVANLGPISFTITPLSMATYGVVTVGIGFVVFAGALHAVGRIDDAKLSN